MTIANAWLKYRQEAAKHGTAKKDFIQFLDFGVSTSQAYIAAVSEEETDETDSAAAACYCSSSTSTELLGCIWREAFNAL